MARNYMAWGLVGAGLGYVATQRSPIPGRRQVRLVPRRLEPTPHRDKDRPMGHRAIEVDPEADYASPRELTLRTVAGPTVRTVMMEDEVPPGFNHGIWSAIRGTIQKTEGEVAGRAWKRFTALRNAYLANPKGKDAGSRKDATIDAYLAWVYTQRFKYAGIRPDMSVPQLWENITHAVKQSKIPAILRLARVDVIKNMPRGSRPPTVPTNPNSKSIISFVGSSEKVKKGEGRGYATSVVYLSPSTEAGFNICKMASKGCREACLGFSSGQLTGMQQMARRMRRTLWYLLFRDSFLHKLTQEIGAATGEAASEGYTPVFRLNGSSDIEWELPENGAIPALFPQFIFYDYTKLPLADRRLAVEETKAGRMQYLLTYSFSDSNQAVKWSTEYLQAGVNVAIVIGLEGNFKSSNKSRPHHLNAAKAFIRYANRNGVLGFKALNGDKDDLRFLDYKEAARLYRSKNHPGVWVALYAKGALAARDLTGFVVRVTDQGVPVDRRMRQERRFPVAGAGARLPYRRRRIRRGSRDAEQMMNWYESSMNDNC